VTDEDEYFPPPPELRDLSRALVGALVLGLGAPFSAEGFRDVDAIDPASSGVPEAVTLAGDRQVSAADVLARLAG
jgi:hypothetical protein